MKKWYFLESSRKLVIGIKIIDFEENTRKRVIFCVRNLGITVPRPIIFNKKSEKWPFFCPITLRFLFSKKFNLKIVGCSNYEKKVHFCQFLIKKMIIFSIFLLKISFFWRKKHFRKEAWQSFLLRKWLFWSSNLKPVLPSTWKVLKKKKVSTSKQQTFFLLRGWFFLLPSPPQSPFFRNISFYFAEEKKIKHEEAQAFSSGITIIFPPPPPPSEWNKLKKQNICSRKQIIFVWNNVWKFKKKFFWLKKMSFVF